MYVNDQYHECHKVESVLFHEVYRAHAGNGVGELYAVCSRIAESEIISFFTGEQTRRRKARENKNLLLLH